MCQNYSKLNEFQFFFFMILITFIVHTVKITKCNTIIYMIKISTVLIKVISYIYLLCTEQFLFVNVTNIYIHGLSKNYAYFNYLSNNDYL